MLAMVSSSNKGDCLDIGLQYARLNVFKLEHKALLTGSVLE